MDTVVNVIELIGGASGRNRLDILKLCTLPACVVNRTVQGREW